MDTALTGTAVREPPASGLPDPPGPRRGLPFARLAAFRRDPLAFVAGMHERWGDIAYFRFGPRNMYLLSHPDFVRDVLVARHREFIKSYALQRARVLLGQGLLTSEDPLHMRQRRLAQPAFHRERIAALGATMVRHAAAAGARRTSGETLDVQREMNRLALAIAGETLFGADVQGEADAIREALNHVLRLFGRLSNPFGRLLDYLPIPGTIRMARARRRLDDTIHRIIAARRASGEDRGDLLSMLLAARDEEGDGGGMTDTQLRDEVLTLFLAGHETTANALSWTWHLLAANPEAEARFHAELDSVLGGRLPAAEDVPGLVHTRRVLAESMRLYPPAWALGREPLYDVALGGYRVRAGSVVLMSPWVIHRDPRFFPDPLRFDPERWTPEREEALPRMAYFPFGGGPRKCIGEGFAWMEGVLVLAAIGQRWRFRPVPGQEVATAPSITLRARNLAMRAEPRG